MPESARQCREAQAQPMASLPYRGDAVSLQVARYDVCSFLL